MNHGYKNSQRLNVDCIFTVSLTEHVSSVVSDDVPKESLIVSSETSFRSLDLAASPVLVIPSRKRFTPVFHIDMA